VNSPPPPTIGITIQTPQNPVKWPYQAPKFIDLDLGTLILSEEMMFLIFRIFMSNLNELCSFYHDPNVGFNLPWSG